MNEKIGPYQVVELPPGSRVWVNALDLSWPAHTMYGLLEVDVTVARKLIAEHKAHTTVLCDLTAQSSGGNLSLNLAGMALAGLSAETGGGNLAVVLPEEAADLSVTARSGAGNVTVEIGRGLSGNNFITAKTGAGDVVVHIPDGVAARIQAVTGLGKAIVDPRFNKIEAHTYQSPDFERAAAKVELDLSSGAGNVKVS